MKRILTSLAAAAVLVTAAVTVVAIGGTAADADESPVPEPPGVRMHYEDADVVPPGPPWLDEEADAPGPGPGFGQGLQGEGDCLYADFWDDGVLDEDEIAQLPDWHPLRNLDDDEAALLEGGLTLEEHEQLQAQAQERRDERAALRAERRAGAQGRWEARSELRAQHQAECELDPDCDYEPIGEGLFGGGRGRRGPNV